MSIPNLPYKYICIEGNIGTGKSSFVQKLEALYNARTVYEEFDDNPFLPFFYNDPDRYAFTVELFFMTERYKQLQNILLARDLFYDHIISDYFFTKTLLFARSNLPEDEYRMFQMLFGTLDKQFPKPDLLVYLHRSPDILLQNIAKRGREYEKSISGEYLTKIQNSYFDYFKNIVSYPILIIDMKTIDFIENEDHFKTILHLISKKYNPGVHRYSLSI